MNIHRPNTLVMISACALEVHYCRSDYYCYCYSVASHDGRCVRTRCTGGSSRRSWRRRDSAVCFEWWGSDIPVYNRRAAATWRTDRRSLCDSGCWSAKILSTLPTVSWSPKHRENTNTSHENRPTALPQVAGNGHFFEDLPAWRVLISMKWTVTAEVVLL